MWLNVGTLALNEININNISKILIDNRYKCNIIPKNHTGYYFHKIVNDPLTIIILQHYFKSNESEENKFIDIRDDNEVYINMNIVTDYMHLPIFNALCHLYIRDYYKNNKYVPDIEKISILPKSTNNELTNTFNIKLFDYQKNNIMRMIDIENNYNMTFDRNLEIQLNNMGLYWDPHYDVICDKPSICHITSNGGILADSMGLGKTITAIGLLHYGKVLDKDKVETSKLYTKATLIIVPSHLAKQWVDEYTKAYGNNKKIVIILTKIHHDKTSYNDIINADIVIVTIQFLLNIKNYCTINYGSIVHLNNFDYESRYNFIVDNHIEMMETNKDYLNTKKPLFECFHFNRMIIDEGHEIMEQTSYGFKMGEYISHLICNIDSNYKWYISGTPFTTYKGLVNILNFLNVTININNNIIRFAKNHNNILIEENGLFMDGLYGYLSTNEILIRLLNTFSIRHLKEDINDIHFLGYKENIMWIDLTFSEKKIYDSKKNSKTSSSNRKLLQQICCHPLIAESFKKIIGDTPLSLEDVQDKIIQHHNKIINTYTKKIETLDRNNQAYHMTLKTYQAKISESTFVLKTLNHIININEEENCIICYENMIEPIMTPCAHLFCENCIKTCINMKPECPMCKSHISMNELVNIKPKKELPNNNAINGILNPLIDKYGSKLGKLIQITRTLLSQNARIIIFSQWDDMLLLIRKSLLENEIDCSFISGNVYKRNKAISNFKLGNNHGVILLSLANSASGTNLTEATHIIIVEPIDNTKENIKAIEGQAIGRAVRIGQKQQIEVIRILCKNTIEEEIYNDKYK